MKTKIIFALVVFCSSCGLSDEFSDQMTIHVKNQIENSQFKITSTNYEESFDSLTVELQENETTDFTWKPILKGGEGTFRFEIIDNNKLIEFRGYYTHNKLSKIDTEYWVTVTSDSLSFERF